MKRILQAIRYGWSMLPVAKSYWRQHGTFALLKRSIEIQYERSMAGSAYHAGRWSRMDDPRLEVRKAPSSFLDHGRVAIIGALELDQCKKYRVLQKIEELKEGYGLHVMVSSYQDIQRGFDILQLATALIFYRVPYGEFFWEYLREARRLNLPVFYDIDDPTFDERVYKSNANLRTLAREESEHLVGQCPLYLKAAMSVDACIASTPRLQELLESLVRKPAYLWRNAIDAESMAIARLLECRSEVAHESNVPKAGRVTIGYMSGSRAHDLDFAVMVEALADVLERNPTVQLLIKGHASLPSEFNQYGDRIERVGFSSYYDYFRSLARCDVVVVPLLDDEFNACKSAIRYMEASLVRKPSIVSPVGDVRNLATHEVDVLFARDRDEWVNGMQELIGSPESRIRISRSARENVMAECRTEQVAKSLDRDLMTALCGQDEE